jgi:hypothetical protein
MCHRQWLLVFVLKVGDSISGLPGIGASEASQIYKFMAFDQVDEPIVEAQHLAYMPPDRVKKLLRQGEFPLVRNLVAAGDVPSTPKAQPAHHFEFNSYGDRYSMARTNSKKRR